MTIGAHAGCFWPCTSVCDTLTFWWHVLCCPLFTCLIFTSFIGWLKLCGSVLEGGWEVMEVGCSLSQA